MPSVINIAILVESMDPSMLRKNYFGRLTLDGPYLWHNRRTILLGGHPTGRYHGNSDSISAKDL